MTEIEGHSPLPHPVLRVAALPGASRLLLAMLLGSWNSLDSYVKAPSDGHLSEALQPVQLWD